MKPVNLGNRQMPTNIQTANNTNPVEYVADWAQKAAKHERTPKQVIGTYAFAFAVYAACMAGLIVGFL